MVKRTTFFKAITTLLLVLLLCAGATGCGDKRQSEECWLIEEIQKDEMYVNCITQVYATDKVSSGKYKISILRQTIDDKYFIDIWMCSIECFSGIWKYPAQKDITYIDCDYCGSYQLVKQNY